ncbi:MAG TPA: glutamate--tRNA ligase family protein [Phycisphaerales bacterium]|nr:glutamate--tRNA ligase family protein [Phycisphaerales bacterium]
MPAPLPSTPAPPPTTRLAPSPTGALHLGNARTFLVTWAWARQQGMRIVLRVEDLDTPRVKPGVLDLTVDLLAWLGMDWDQGPITQSHDLPRHRDAMTKLVRDGHAFPDARTRKQLEELASPQSAPNEGSHELVFPASLRPATWPRDFRDDAPAWRFATPPDPIAFHDDFAGPQVTHPARTIGDFIIWTRRDAAVPGQPAYQLAVVVDDAAQGITHIMRGDDLIESTGRQLLLSRALGFTTTPTYAHLPLVRGSDGRRLAKRHGDTRLDIYRERGVTAERVIGLVAHWCGITPRRQSMSVNEFRDALRLSTIPRGSITFTAEDDSWLLAKT